MFSSDDVIPERSDPLDLELDDVARLEPAPVAVLEDAAASDGARAEDVTGQQPRMARGVAHDRLPRVVHVDEVAARSFLAVDARDHRPAPSVELVGRDDDRAEARREV